MPANRLRPRLPSHYEVWSGPAAGGEGEVLYFVSSRRRVKLEGRSLGELERRVLPLLDGRRTVAELQAATSDVFAPADLAASLDLLAAHGLLAEGDPGEDGGDADCRYEPRRNFLHEVFGDGPAMAQRLAAARVAVVGLGGAGADVALALAELGVGELRLVDDLPVAPVDTYLSGALARTRPGAPRTQATAERIAASVSGLRVVEHAGPLLDEGRLREALAGVDCVACCLDGGRSAAIHKLNRVALALALPWTAVAVGGTEVVLGPTVLPGETACHLCYTMRSVACAESPEDELAYRRRLDTQRRDDSGRRENLTIGAALAAQLLALETAKCISRLVRPSALGGIVVLDLLALTTQRHTVLRQPGCPACFP